MAVGLQCNVSALWSWLGYTEQFTERTWAVVVGGGAKERWLEDGQGADNMKGSTEE